MNLLQLTQKNRIYDFLKKHLFTQLDTPHVQPSLRDVFVPLTLPTASKKKMKKINTKEFERLAKKAQEPTRTSFFSPAGTECTHCGIVSFDHLHQEGEPPKNFIKVNQDIPQFISVWEHRGEIEVKTPIKKLSRVKKNTQSTLSGQRELIREMRNKINEIVDVINLTKKV